MAGISSVSAVNAYATQSDISKKKTSDKNSDKNSAVKAAAKQLLGGAPKTVESEKYGKTVGEPKLSEKAQKYYEQLKKKYGQYDFVLVSSAEKKNAQKNASKYANGIKTVVLIDEEKIERMATDENYRKQYEGILSGARNQLEQLKSGMESSGANVKGYGMKVNDDGTTSFFAVLKKSSADRKARIEKKSQEKRAEKKAAAKKAEKKKQEERIKEIGEKRAEKSSDEDDWDEWDYDEDDVVTITANSIEELMSKIGNFVFEDRSNSVFTDSELQVGQTIDFKG